MISLDLIESTANELMRKAAVEIPRDYLTALQQVTAEEEAGLGPRLRPVIHQARQSERPAAHPRQAPRSLPTLPNQGHRNVP